MSRYVWSLGENNKIPSIKWKIVKIVYSKATSSFCKLCLTEKLFILNALGDDKCLNKKTEFINKCRHQNKLFLKNVKDNMDWNLVSVFAFEYFVRIVFSFYHFFLLGKRIWSICTPDNCKKHKTQSSVLELSCCLIQLFVIFKIYVYIYYFQAWSRSKFSNFAKK